MKYTVVIPFQTNGFYNKLMGSTNSAVVVIPFQTNGFYNSMLSMSARVALSYHSKRTASTTNKSFLT